MTRIEGLVLMLVLGVATPASADVRVTIEIEPPAPVDEGAARAAIDEAVAPTDRAIELVVRVDASGAVEIRVRDGDDERERRAQLPDDPQEAAQALALLAANTVANEADGLIEDAPPARTVEVVPPPVVPPPVVPPLEEPNLALRRPVHFGASGILGITSTPAGSGVNVAPFGAYGINLGFTVDRMVTLGISRLSVGGGFSSVESTILTFQGTPTLELFGFVDPRIQVYGQIGVALQGRYSGFFGGSFQAAAYIGGGARFWVLDWFSIGVEVGLHLVLTDFFTQMGGVEIPRWSMFGTLGLSAEFHF